MKFSRSLSSFVDEFLSVDIVYLDGLVAYSSEFRDEFYKFRLGDLIILGEGVVFIQSFFHNAYVLFERISFRERSEKHD